MHSRLAAVFVGSTLLAGVATTASSVSPRVERSQELALCMSNELPAQTVATLTPNERKYLQATDSFVANYIRAVFGSGPYPSCLCGAVRNYYFLTDDTSRVARELARRRREDADKLMQVIANAR
jgi:hypothetical protein